MSLFDSASLIVTSNGYKEDKLYSIKPNFEIGVFPQTAFSLVVTRATTATRVNSSGLIESVATNVPRLDYTNSSCPSILVEPQRTNLLTYSEQFDNAAWTKSNATITANTTISPDGNNNADTYNVVSTTANLIYQNPTLTTGAYSISVYAKKASSNIIRLFNVTSGTSAAWFDLNLGQVIGTVNGGTASIENAGNGWYRCVYKGTSITSGFTGIGLSDTANSATASIGSSVFIWGAQLEAGSNATSYIPTVASSVTRNADVISKTGISSLIGQTEGTLFIDFNLAKTPSDANGRLLQLWATNDTTNAIIPILNQSNQLQISMFKDSIGNAVIPASSSTLLSLGRNKIAVAYTSTTLSVYRNGVLFATGNPTSVFPSSLNSLNLGCSSFANRSLENTINSAILFKTRLTNTELAQLTTI